MDGTKLKRLMTLGGLCLAASATVLAADAVTTTATTTTSGLGTGTATSTSSGTTGTTGTIAGTTSTTATATGASTAAKPESLDPAQLTSRFETFAGSTENAQALVTGLRKGSAITLTADGDASASGTVSFTPPTKPMGYGEISRALSLAEAQLAAQGITDPTPEQLQVALMGGSITQGSQTFATTGVLQLRSRGMGWGQIAHALNVTASARMNAPAPTATGVRGVRGGTTTGAKGAFSIDSMRGSKSSITTASGAVVGTRANASSASAHGGHGGLSSGALTAGTATITGASMSFGSGQAFQHGVVSGGGLSANGAGGAGGHGLALGLGR